MVKRRQIRNKCMSAGVAYRVQIANNDLAILLWIKEFIGGAGGIYRKPVQSYRHNATYLWIVEKFSDVLAFLELVYPYVKIKQERVELAISLMKNHVHYKTQSYEWEAVETFKKLNKRGLC